LHFSVRIRQNFVIPCSVITLSNAVFPVEVNFGQVKPFGTIIQIPYELNLRFHLLMLFVGAYTNNSQRVMLTAELLLLQVLGSCFVIFRVAGSNYCHQGKGPYITYFACLDFYD
jgi:hypothetical protein